MADAAAVSLCSGFVIFRLIDHAIKIPIITRIAPIITILYRNRFAVSKTFCFENSTTINQLVLGTGSIAAITALASFVLYSLISFLSVLAIGGAGTTFIR